MALAALAAAACQASRSPGGDGPPSPGEKAGQPAMASASPAALPADNSRCYVCHLNFEEELVVLAHARAGVGCETCHGKSTAHCSDENNITPPDILYPRDKVNAACGKCHGKFSSEHAGVVAGSPEKKYCTDCHGQHRLAVRTQRWDKNTGKE